MSNPIPWHRGITAGGKFTPANPIAFKAAFGAIEGETAVAVRKYRANRSNNQNKYYWGVVLEIISDYTGYTPEEAHEMMKILFLSRLVKLKKKKAKTKRQNKAKKKAFMVRVTKSTASLNTAQFETYLEKIRRFAATKLDGLYIPLPNETV